MDTILLDATLEEKWKSNQVDGTWTTTTYENMVRVLLQYFGPIVEKDNVKNASKTLKRATGEHAESARGKVMRWQKERTSTDVYLNIDNINLSANEANHGQLPSESIGAENAFSLTPPSMDSQGGNSSRGTKRKVQLMEALDTHFETVTLGIQEVAYVMREANKFMERALVILEHSNEIVEKSLEVLGRGRPHCYHKDEIFKVLKELGFPQHFVVKALRFLVKNEDERRIVFVVPPEMRGDLLIAQMQMHG